MFMDDSLHEADLEPTEFSESLHVSDLEDDAFPESTEPMPEPVLPPVAEEAGEGGIFGAALKVGALGAVLLASKKFTEFLNKLSLHFTNAFPSVRTFSQLGLCASYVLRDFSWTQKERCLTQR